MSGIAKNHGLTANNRIVVVYRILDISFGAAAPYHRLSLKSLYKIKVRQAQSRLPHHTRFAFSSRASAQTGYSSQVANFESLRLWIDSRLCWERPSSRD
jgi:hypothetical protein